MAIVRDAAHQNDLPAVSRVVLEIGPFSGVDVGALEFALNVLRKGTLLEGAEIEYQVPPLLLYCTDCENEYVADPLDLACPSCEGTHFEWLQGKELRVKSIVGGGNGPAV